MPFWDRILRAEAAPEVAAGSAREPETVADSAPGGSGSTVPGWRELPPIQRRLGDIEPAVSARKFDRSLHTGQTLNLLGEMSHSVSPVAPSGIVDGLIQAEPGSADSYSRTTALALPGDLSPRQHLVQRMLSWPSAQREQPSAPQPSARRWLGRRVLGRRLGCRWWLCRQVLFQKRHCRGRACRRPDRLTRWRCGRCGRCPWPPW